MLFNKLQLLNCWNKSYPSPGELCSFPSPTLASGKTGPHSGLGWGSEVVGNPHPPRATAALGGRGRKGPADCLMSGGLEGLQEPRLHSTGWPLLLQGCSGLRTDKAHTLS